MPEFCGCYLNKLEDKNFLYLLAVHNKFFKSAIKWGKPLCFIISAAVGMTNIVVLPVGNIYQIHVQGVSFEYTVLNIQTDKWIDHGLGDDDLIQVLVGK